MLVLLLVASGCSRAVPDRYSPAKVCDEIVMALEDSAQLLSQDLRAQSVQGLGATTDVTVWHAMIDDRLSMLRALAHISGAPVSDDDEKRGTLTSFDPAQSRAACLRRLAPLSAEAACGITADLVEALGQSCKRVTSHLHTFGTSQASEGATDGAHWLTAVAASRACSDMARAAALVHGVAVLTHLIETPISPSSHACSSLVPSAEAGAPWRDQWLATATSVLEPLATWARNVVSALPPTCRSKSIARAEFCVPPTAPTD